MNTLNTYSELQIKLHTSNRLKKKQQIMPEVQSGCKNLKVLQSTFNVLLFAQLRVTNISVQVMAESVHRDINVDGNRFRQTAAA